MATKSFAKKVANPTFLRCDRFIPIQTRSKRGHLTSGKGGMKQLVARILCIIGTLTSL